jgi:hypothetical protein
MDDINFNKKNNIKKADKTLELKEDLKLWNILL